MELIKPLKLTRYSVRIFQRNNSRDCTADTPIRGHLENYGLEKTPKISLIETQISEGEQHNHVVRFCVLTADMHLISIPGKCALAVSFHNYDSHFHGRAFLIAVLTTRGAE